MSDFPFTKRLTLNYCHNKYCHGHESKVYGNITDGCRVDLRQNTLDVPERPAEEWCQARGGNQQLVFIPVYCKVCKVWTIHAYSDFGEGPEWKTFQFKKLGGSSVDFRFLKADDQSKPLCDLIEMIVRFGVGNRKFISFPFPIVESSNTPLFTFKVELFKAFLYNATKPLFTNTVWVLGGYCYDSPYLLGLSRRFIKLCRISQDSALRNFLHRLASYVCNAELLKQAAIGAVGDIYRLRESSGGPSLKLPRELLQLAVLDYDPEARATFLDAGVPIPIRKLRGGEGAE